MQKITPFLWFDGNAEEAMDFYTSIFKNSKIDYVTFYGKAGPGKKGKVMSVTFRLAGQDFIALNGGPQFRFNQAVSLFINCKDQKEVDYYWNKLSKGGEKQRCGWLRDRFGLYWQVVPTILGELLADKNQVKANKVMQAMLKMHKIDIETLKRAFRQK